MRIRPKKRALIISASFALGTLFLIKGSMLVLDIPSKDSINRSPASLSPIQAPPPHCENLYEAVCKPKSRFKDPTGVVNPDHEGEIQALRLYQEIIRTHPTWDLNEVDEELVKKIYTKDSISRIKKAYTWVQNEVLNWIQERPDKDLSPASKRTLTTLVQKTELQLPLPASLYDDERELFTKNDVFYERESNLKASTSLRRLRIGGAFVLSIQSWFNLIYTMAHEFGHAFDPCELRSEAYFFGDSFEEFPAFESLTSCFLSNGFIQNPTDRKQCYNNDQLSESFADWLATEITARALKSHKPALHDKNLIHSIFNSVKDLCEVNDDAPNSTEFHPSPQIRINTIFGGHPEIRNLLGCLPTSAQPEKSYCTLSGINQKPNSPKKDTSP